MDINQLTKIVKKKIKKKIRLDNIIIEDCTFRHKNHKNHSVGKFHLKLTIQSEDLKKYNKIQSNRLIYKILNNEIKDYIHSLQLNIN